MGLLGDLYSTIDSTKRKVRGLLDDPVETAKFYLQNLNEDAGKKRETLSKTFNGEDGKPFSGPMSKKSKAAVDELTGDMVNAMVGQTVYHGSPHRFKKFDSSKIGTGEGAQAYGHGLYFAENPAVARSYKDMFTRVDVDGKPLMANNRQVGTTGDPVIDIHLMAANGDLDDAVAYLRKEQAARPQAGNLEDIAKLEALRGKVQASSTGSLYKADLSDQAIPRMLDWDKPLSQQTPEVQKAIRSTDWHKQAASRMNGANARLFTHPDESPGSHIYKVMTDADKASAEKLRAAGIPGIRYLDGQSRGAGGTSNFVVFPGNEDLLRILEINGSPIF